MTAVEQEALQLANNFKGAGHNFASVTIDKNNIFLGATVKNDDAKVVISRIVAGGAVENDGRLQEGKVQRVSKRYKNFVKLVILAIENIRPSFNFLTGQTFHKCKFFILFEQILSTAFTVHEKSNIS